MKKIALLLLVVATPCFAADIKPTFTAEQAQTVLNLTRTEMTVAVATGNYPALEQLTAVAKEIMRAAQEAQRPPSPTAEAPK